MTETNRIEFKREFTRDLDIEREVVAFLNYREGGVIYIGIDNNGNPVGVKDIDGDMLRIKDRIRTGVSPSPMGLFDVTVERMEDVPVIKIFVSSGSEKPYCKAKYGLSEKGCFIRVGSAAEPMPVSMIDDLYAHRVRNSLRNIRSPRKNLTFRQLHIYYESKGLSLNDHFMENLDLLTDNGEPNYVAFLLADENNVSIKVAKYAGKDRDILIANNELGFCSLLKATDNVLDKLRVENNVSSEITYKRRIDSPLWDERAMREIVINAIVHNDYYTNEVPPKFEIFSDHIEIISAGRLPIDMTQEEFFSGVSSPRNKELMRVFRDVEMVEALGSGMLRIGKVYSLKRIFSFTTNFIKTSIPFHSQKTGKKDSSKDTRKDTRSNVEILLAYCSVPQSLSEMMQVLNLKNRASFIRNYIKPLVNQGFLKMTLPDNSTSKHQKYIATQITQEWGAKASGNGNVVKDVTKDVVKEILSCIRADGTITAKVLAERLSLSSRQVQRILSQLQNDNMITRVGGRKNGRWEVMKTDEE